jgi:uncharacterized protein (TIGR02301 family)
MLGRLAFAILFAGFATVANAQPQPQRPTESAEQPLRGDAWYRAQLIELAEVLGGSHYLRTLCEGSGSQRWRDYMRGIIQREPQYNAVLVEGFNRGYRNEEARFHTCDQQATQMEAELRAQGLRVSQALRARHAQ